MFAVRLSDILIEFGDKTPLNVYCQAISRVGCFRTG